MGRSRGLRLLANSGVLYLHVPAHTRVHISFSQSFSSSLHATQPVRTPARIIHVRGQGMRVHTSDSHKERSPSGQCAAISIPREGKLSQAKRERYLRKRKSLSLSFSLSSLSRYRSYRDCFRERLAKEDRDAVHRREYSYHDAPPRSFSFRKRIHVVDRSIAQDATDRFYQTKRTLVSPIQRGDPFLSVG